jgi:peptidyl-prolyl cis-trans isomerase SurA
MKFEVAVKRFSDKKSRSYNNNGRMTNPATQTTFYEMKDLPPDIYFAIEGLKPGDITSVMETTNEAGETRFQIIKVLTKTEPHRASLKEDYSRIQNFAKASKKNEYINNWIAKKIKTTYIKIDDEYRKCPNLMKWYEDNK